jgi:hypothetical protein
MTATEARELAIKAWTDTSHADDREHKHGYVETDDYWGCVVGVRSFSAGLLPSPLVRVDPDDADCSFPCYATRGD